MILDHRITLEYLTSAEVKRIGESLRSDPSETRDGWYLRAYCNEGYDDIVKLTHIPAEAAQDIADFIEDRCGEFFAGNLSNRVQAVNIEHRNRRERQLELLRERIAADTEHLARLERENA